MSYCSGEARLARHAAVARRGSAPVIGRQLSACRAYRRVRNVGGTTKWRIALSSQTDERAFLLAEERTMLCHMPGHQAKDESNRRLTTGGATARAAR
jgi:hypothetical protein